MDKNSSTIDDRFSYFDFLRVAGAFAIMVIHMSSETVLTKDVFSLEWEIMNFYKCVTRWAVPIFVMISGALFLNREIPLRKIYGKYIFRILTAFFFWSFIYATASYVAKRDAVKAVELFIKGQYHMWFLLMIMGLYALHPFLKKIAESETLTKYFLALSFVTASLVPETVRIISLFSEEYGTFADSFTKCFYLDFAVGFTGYFLLGYCLNNVSITKKTERLIYILGIIGFAATILMSLYASRFKGEPFDFYEENMNMSVNVLCEAVAVFVFFKKKLNFPVKIIRVLSQYSFGAYLVHVAVISELIRLFGRGTPAFNPMFSIPLSALIVFVISFAISAVLNHVPVLKKYIV